MAWNNPKYKRSEVSQTFNLKELLGREPTDRDRQEFVRKITELMRDRTLGGNDIEGAAFEIYSKDYAKRKGVSRDSVNLTLTGTMLSSIISEPVRKNLVKIKLESSQSKKGYNHCVGDTLPKRTFFGVKEEDAREVVQDIVPAQTIGDLLDLSGGLFGELIDGEN